MQPSCSWIESFDRDAHLRGSLSPETERWRVCTQSVPTTPTSAPYADIYSAVLGAAAVASAFSPVTSFQWLYLIKADSALLVFHSRGSRTTKESSQPCSCNKSLHFPSAKALNPLNLFFFWTQLLFWRQPRMQSPSAIASCFYSFKLKLVSGQ